MIVAISLGLLLGILTGVLPGIGATTLLLSMYTILGAFSILELFVFYSVLMTSLQYYGNVSSILYGVYGEITSGPAIKHGHALFKKNSQLGIDALIYTSTGSFIGSLLALGLLALAFQHASELGQMFGNTAKVVIVTLAVVLLISTTRNRWLGILAAVVAVVIGKIGYDGLFDTRFLSGYSSNFMDGGIPSISVFVGLLALPQLWEMYQTRNLFDFAVWKDTTFSYRLRTLLTMPYKMSALRGSLIGVITGLIPGISYVVSSSVANSVEEKLCHRAEDSENETHFKCVVSAESANNAGSMIVLIPLLVLALPVIPSEAVIFSIAEKSGFGYSTSYSFLLANGSLMVGILMAVNIFNWVVSGVFYNAVSKIFNSVKTYIYQSLIVFVLIMVALTASENNQIMLTMSCLAVFTAVGLYIRDFGLKTTFLFTFLLADTIVNEYYRFYLLNF